MRTFIYSMAVVLVVALTGCQDLSVENTNSPDREQALSTPGDIESLVGGTFTDFWSATQWCGQSMMLSTMADAHSGSWANWGMQDMSSEPRIAWNNDPSYSRAGSNEGPWFNNYVAISNASDVIGAIENIDASAFEEAGVDVARAEAFANFVMGLSYGHIAATYDRAFLVDETTDLEAVATGTANLELAPYTDVVDFAKSKLDNAIQIASSNDFTITAEEDWIFGITVTSADMVLLANSFKARYEAYAARTPEERASRDWNSILTSINNGITESFVPVGDDSGSLEWDCQKFYGEEENTWARADYRTIGPADESGGYENWLNSPLADRSPFVTETPDRRIAGADGPETDGKDMIFVGTAFTAFPVDRGIYHYSDRTFKRYAEYLDEGANGPMPHMQLAEMDLLKAEALLRTGGSIDEVVVLINKTRVERGELAPATADMTVGTPTDNPNPITSDADSDPVTIWSMLKYEFNVETMLTAAGLNFFTDRGWGDLVEGTPLHFPVPGQELQTLGADIYSFGGVGGTCASGSPGGCLSAGGGGSKAAAQRFVFQLEDYKQSDPLSARAMVPTRPN